MARIRQFAKDMGLSYNEAKNLVNKGRRLKDGGSATLEKFMPVKAKNGKVTRINKDKTMQAKSGQFKNIVKDSVSGKITPEEAQKMIRKLVIAKQKGGGFDLSKISEENLTDEERKKESRRLKNEILKLSKPGTKLKDIGEDARFGNLTSGRPKKRRQPQGSGKYMSQFEKDMAKAKAKGDVNEQKRLQAIERSKAANKKAAMGIGAKAQSIKGGPGPQGKKLKRMKDGGAAFPDLSGDGKVTKKDILIGRGVIKKSRGGGLAIQGLGFKGVR